MRVAHTTLEAHYASLQAKKSQNNNKNVQEQHSVAGGQQTLSFLN
jgi:hypothetical protein